MTGSSEGVSAEKRLILIMKQSGNVRVVQQALAQIGMVGVALSSESDLKEELARKKPANFALVDVSGFGKSVWKLCEMLHQSLIPFIVLSTPQDKAVSSRSLSYGAVSILNKPVAKAALLQLVQNLYQPLGRHNRQEGTHYDKAKLNPTCRVAQPHTQ